MKGNATSSFRSGLARAALGLALAVGSGAALTAVSAPAIAAPAPKMTPGFQKLAAPLNQAINAARTRADVVAAKGNPTALGTALAKEKADLDALFAAIGNQDDRLIAGQLAVGLGSLAEDTAIQRRGVDAMLASGKAPAADVGKLHFYSGQFAYLAKDYAAARTSFQAAIAAGYKENDVEVLLAESYLADNQAAQGLAMLQQAIDTRRASGQPVPESWYKRGLLAAYKTKAGPQASAFASGLVRANPSTQNWGIAITIIREIGGIPSQDMLDLLRLMGRTNSYNEARDYLEYVEAADPRRLPGEVLKVLDAGQASGKLPASDRIATEARASASGRVAADRASLPALEKAGLASGATAVTALANGDALLSYDEPAKAEALYSAALSKPGVDAPRALTRLGIAQVDQGKYTEAQATFAKITGPRKPIADLWSAYAASKARGGS